MDFNFRELVKFLYTFFQAMNQLFFLMVNFINQKYLPISYLPLWIILTTPLFILALFFFGFIIGMIRFSARFIKANNFSKNIYTTYGLQK